jgi:hypothetical protein
MLILSVAMFLVILFVFGSIRMILLLNACVWPSLQDSLQIFLECYGCFGISYNDPWVCSGDFHPITSPDDKLGGRPFDSFSSNLFSDFMDEFGMIDLGFSGNPFTWSNHRQDSSLIKERLDRGIANSNWSHYFPSYSVTHLPAHRSNHYPLLLNTSLPVPSLPRPFRFEEFWTRDPIYGIVIEETWSPFIVDSPSYCLTKKLKLTKAAIKLWNKHYFGNIKSKLDNTLSSSSFIG